MPKRTTPSYHSSRFYKNYPEKAPTGTTPQQESLMRMPNVPLPNRIKLEKKDIVLLIPAVLLVFAGSHPGDFWTVVPCLFLSWICLIVLCVWHAGPRKLRTVVGVVITVIFFGFSFRWIWIERHKPGSGVQVQTQPPLKPCAMEDPLFVPPKGPLYKFEGSAEPSSQLMCVGLSEESRKNCLCPNPVDFSVGALPAPKDDNYETQLILKTKCNPMYRVRVFLRDMHGGLNLVETYPNENTAAATIQQQWDPYSFEVYSVYPQMMYRINVKSATGLRVICVDQLN